MIVRKSRAIWLTKTVDITARLQLPVVTYTSPGLRKTIRPALSWGLRKLGGLL